MANGLEVKLLLKAPAGRAECLSVIQPRSDRIISEEAPRPSPPASSGLLRLHADALHIMQFDHEKRPPPAINFHTPALQNTNRTLLGEN
ncbi:MAG: hypothetical protein JRC68_08975 [Deltaproteobacteria bacterium]|nr:hypothetical protein [Deltaproteobacteria bacterium]